MGPAEFGLSIKPDSALNTPFSDWGNILFNTTIATAIADRLVENSEIFLFGGDSLRKPTRNAASPDE
jgi:DNA replication protein DnaC